MAGTEIDRERERKREREKETEDYIWKLNRSVTNSS